MATKKNTPVDTAADKTVEEQEAVGPFVGMIKTKNGWAVIKLFVQGNRVIDRQVASEPDVKLVSMEKFKLVVAREIFGAKN